MVYGYDLLGEFQVYARNKDFPDGFSTTPTEEQWEECLKQIKKIIEPYGGEIARQDRSDDYIFIKNVPDEAAAKIKGLPSIHSVSPNRPLVPPDFFKKREPWGDNVHYDNYFEITVKLLSGVTENKAVVTCKAQ